MPGKRNRNSRNSQQLKPDVPGSTMELLMIYSVINVPTSPLQHQNIRIISHLSEQRAGEGSAPLCLLNGACLDHFHCVPTFLPGLILSENHRKNLRL